MSLATWLRRWNSPESRQKRKKARHDAWVEASNKTDAVQASRGPTVHRRYSVYDEDVGYNPPQD